jgi:hypothetical protein
VVVAEARGASTGGQSHVSGGESQMSAPKNYRNFAEFEREEIRPDQKLGWSIDDLWKDADMRMSDGHYEERDPEELDFGN